MERRPYACLFLQKSHHRWNAQRQSRNCLLYTSQLEAISENIKQQMQAQMDADENIAYFLNSDLPDSDFKGITGEESYYFNENGELVISFDEYEVCLLYTSGDRAGLYFWRNH